MLAQFILRTALGLPYHVRERVTRVGGYCILEVERVMYYGLYVSRMDL